ncbi:MAG: AAA family ATPase, partial [Sciscionella sp.]
MMAEVGDLETGFVGRAAELAAGQAELARTSSGVSVLAVTGEPGIGKSRYLSEIRRYAERAGWLVAAGQASEQERELPFSAFADALTPLVLGHPALVAGLPVGLVDAVGAVLPAVGEPPSAPGTVLRHHAHLATQALLERLTADRALLLLLDDVHWADDGTVELIDHLLRHDLSGRLLLAVGFRPQQVAGRLAGVLSRAVAEVGVQYIRLGPLSVEQSAELLGCAPADPVAHRLHKAADGNPLYLKTMARTGAAGWSSDMTLPADVSAALRAEVERLPAAAHAVIEAAAVLGTVF